MSRKVNDGDRLGIKQDKFRNSRFEEDARNEQDLHFGGSSRKTPTTLGGSFNENRGRRSADDRVASGWSGPFENGRVSNWKNRHGWDSFYDRSHDRRNRSYGGGQLDHEGSHFGKGPKGYKRSDESIYEDACYSLLMSRDVDASEIEVKIKDGIVYLTGTVTDRNAKRLAELEVENVSGVKDVQNQLTFTKESQKEQDLH